MRFQNAKTVRFAILCSAAFVFAGLDAPARSEEELLSGVESWAYRPARPAVVNPAVRSPLQETLSLRGPWEFVTRGVAPSRQPVWQAFYAEPWPGSRTLDVPGCWEAQGVGVPGMSDSWDCKWDHAAKPLRHVYLGEGWYRKSVAIPAKWRGKRIWLKVGGVRSQGWFWVNNKPVAWVDSYCGTYKYDVTDLVQPGQQAVVVAAVNNAVPSRKGAVALIHRFGGIYRDVELEATPDMRIDDAWVRGDFEHQTAEVHATIACVAKAAILRNPILRVEVKTADGQPGGACSAAVAWEPNRLTAEVVCRVPLAPFRGWTPESPNLYLADLTLCDGDAPIHGWTERFGVRKIEVRGDRLYLNDKPLFLRGFGDDCVYPVSLASPASKAEHLKHLQKARAAGFNYVRLHTHCEWPEYFEAADEAGIMVQPELPYYGDYPTEAFAFDPIRDLKELHQQYRRYVSLTTYCTGNEGLLGSPLDKVIYQLCKRLDPDRLAIHQDGTTNTAENSDFRGGPINAWAPGGFACDAPFVAHEYLNLSIKQDPRLEPKFSGAILPPTTMAARDKELEAAGLNRRWGDAIQDASHALQRCWQKRGIEGARLDPACDGYDYWTIVDVIIQQARTYTAQGLFDAFWETKRNGATVEFFRQFNGPSTLLLKIDPDVPVATVHDFPKLAFWIAHYGDAPLKKARLRWALRAGDAILVQGQEDIGDVELGDTRHIVDVAIPLVPNVEKPVHAVLEAQIVDSDVKNSWEFWIFPKRERQNGSGIAVCPALLPLLEKHYTGLIGSDAPNANGAGLLISRRGAPDVAPALNAGKRVILINGADGPPNISLGWWWMGNQVGTAFAKHPALGDLPHNGCLSPLTFRIVKEGRPLPFPGVSPENMIVVGEGRENFFLYAGEAQCDKGRAIFTYGLDLLSGTPESLCILDAMIRYAQSDAFAPKSRLEHL